MLRLLRNYLATIVVVVTLAVWRTPLSAAFLTVGTILVLDTFLTNRDRLYFRSVYGDDVDAPLREGRWLSVQAGALGAASAC